MAGRRVIGDYELLEKLGSGLQGKVYKGRDMGTGEVVALKLLDKEKITASARLYENLTREISAMERIRGHPHVIGILKVDNEASKPRKRRAGQFKQCIMLVLELAPGGEMFDYLMLSRFPETIARTYFQQLLEALHHCHAMGVAHRDLKPENLLLDAQYNLRVADWGLSAVMDNIDEGLLRTQCGTVAYMAPEVLRRERYKGEPADIWSAGVVLFIMLAGFPPFERAAPGDWWFDRIASRQHALFWTAHERSAAFPPAAKDLINAIFVAKPADRMTVEGALKHPWLTGATEEPAALKAAMRERRAEIVRGKGGVFEEEADVATALTDVSMEGGAISDDHSSLSTGGPGLFASEDIFARVATRGASAEAALPTRRPAFVFSGPAAVAREGPLATAFPSKMTFAADLHAESLSSEVDMGDSGKLKRFFVKGAGTAAELLAALAGFTESMHGTVNARVEGGAKLRISLPTTAGAFRYDIHVYDATGSDGKADVPADAQFLVDFQRSSGDSFAFSTIVSSYKRAFAPYLAGGTEELAAKGAAYGTVSDLPTVW